MPGSVPVLPSDYDSFVPPKAGGSYADPAFGTKITRVSAAAAGRWISTEYPTVDAFNCDQTMFVLVHVDHFGLYSAAGAFLYELPISASGEPRWSPGDPKTLFWHHAPGNTLKTLNVVTLDAGTVQEFRQFGSIKIGNGEGDISARRIAIRYCRRWWVCFRMAARQRRHCSRLFGGRNRFRILHTGK